MADVWDSSPFEGRALLVELALADFANDEGVCWPAVETLARKARCSESWVHQVLRDLRKSGRISAIGGGGRGRTNMYVMGSKGTASAGYLSEKGVSNTPLSDVKGAVTGPKRVQSDEKRVQSTAPRTVREPSLDPSISLEGADRVKKLFPALDVAAVWEEARDWLKANGVTKKDYEAFLRNWCRKEARYANGRATKAGVSAGVGGRGGRDDGADVAAGWTDYKNGQG